MPPSSLLDQMAFSWQYKLLYPARKNIYPSWGDPHTKKLALKILMPVANLHFWGDPSLLKSGAKRRIPALAGRHMATTRRTTCKSLLGFKIGLV